MISEVNPAVRGILQARMGSSRLPGKVLMHLAGKTILAHCIDRMKESKIFNTIIVATTTSEHDTAICDEAQRNAVSFFRGPEEDVLGRFLGAMALFPSDIVVRVTGDNPLTDPVSIARCVDELRHGQWDYVAEEGLPFGAASEIITGDALRLIGQLARSPAHREHVTLYLRENPQEFRIKFLKSPAEREGTDVRVTVDTEKDLLRLRSFMGQSILTFHPFSMKDFLDRLRQLKPGAGCADIVGGTGGAKCARMQANGERG